MIPQVKVLPSHVGCSCLICEGFISRAFLPASAWAKKERKQWQTFCKDQEGVGTHDMNMVAQFNEGSSGLRAIWYQTICDVAVASGFPLFKPQCLQPCPPKGAFMFCNPELSAQFPTPHQDRLRKILWHSSCVLLMGETAGAKILVSINSILDDWIILNHSGIPVTELGEWSQAIPPAASSLGISYCDNKIHGDVVLASAATDIFTAWMLCLLLGILSVWGPSRTKPSSFHWFFQALQAKVHFVSKANTRDEQGNTEQL